MTKAANPQKRKVKNDSKTWQFLCSVKLAVIIIIVMAAACIAGTIVLQQRAPEEYVGRYGSGLAKFFSAIQFTDIFHSYWFAFLLVLLCVNLGCCTVKRWRNTLLQIGFLVTHISIILILIGCSIDLQFGEKGGVNIYERSSVDYYLTRADYQKVPLGFQVFCDDFIIEKHPPKFKLITYVKDKDRQNAIPVKVGKRISVPGSNYSVSIKDYYPDAEFRQEPVNVSNEPKNPAIYVQLLNSDNITAEGWLLAKDRNWYNDPDRDMKIEYLWANSEEDHDKLARTAGKTNRPMLDIAIEEKKIYKSVPVEEGAIIPIDGTDYKVEIKQFALDYANRNAPLKEQAQNNPAVRVEVSGPQGVDTRWTFSKYPDYWDKAHQAKYKDIKLSCTVPDDYSDVANRVKIVQNKDGRKTLSFIRNKEVISFTDWEVDKSYDLADTGLQLKISRFFPSHSLKGEVYKKSDMIENPAIFVEIEGPRGKVVDWVLSNKPPTWYPDNNFALLYEKSGMEIKDYKSILRVVDDGKTKVTKTIEVNDPLKYKGYVFYQSSYDPEGERYTGLQVTRNPGLVVVYAGFILLCFGVVFIFYVKPFLRRKLKKGQKVEDYYTEEEILAEHIE